MSIKEHVETMYYVECDVDGCDRTGPLRLDPILAIGAARKVGWYVTADGGKHYCPDCWQKMKDEEDKA